ncbi:MAG: molybdenum cofactor guanylyltransferase, partial [Flavobacteriaceae bacterium]
LVEGRNPNKLATCFYNSQTQFPEPLITLWEPKAYPVLLDFLSRGYSCPRKVLINSSIEMLTLEDEKVLFNANTPEDKFKATKVLSNR